MKRGSWVAVFLMAASPVTGVQADTWDATFGIATLHAPVYPGADDRRAFVVPFGTLTYRDRLYVGAASTGTGAALGANLMSGESWRWNAEFVLTEPRRESWSETLSGLGNRNVGRFVGSSVTYREGLLSASLLRGLADRAGTAAVLGAGIGGGIAPRISAAAGVQVTFADREYMNYHHGISSEQALRRAGHPSFADARPFGASGGLKQVEGSIGAFFQPPGNWNAGAFAQWLQLTGDAAASPLTRRRGSPAIGLFVSVPAMDH